MAKRWAKLSPRSETLLGERLEDRRLWSLLKAVFSGLIVERPDWEIAETFFNSVTRKIFTTVGVDSQVEFVDSDFDSPPSEPKHPVYRTYNQPSDIAGLIEQIVIDANLGIVLPDLRSESERAASRIGEHLRKSGDLGVIDRVDLVDAVFYRGKAAYLVGRVASGAHVVPMVLAILNVKGGHIDAVLLTENQVSILFSFTRSYFHVDVERPYDLVAFLRSLMPRKRLSELYIAIGQHKHGKTSLIPRVARPSRPYRREFHPGSGHEGIGDGRLHHSRLRRCDQGHQGSIPGSETHHPERRS